VPIRNRALARLISSTGVSCESKIRPKFRLELQPISASNIKNENSPSP
jgi:hypothetical protein